ncbi:exopolysaccharide biosynthesis polyprenyl glycosylphosphotransferase [Flavobacteriaceae bacterium]|nr:exopolysaccharide biosynthesis polyprenyl glycosylphosphotransferase [Flavobacteriaceae bacterium]
MSLFKQGRYSGFIKPISYVADLALINTFGLLCFFEDRYPLSFLLFISFGWVITSLVSSFYEVHRFSTIIRILKLLFRQILLFSLLIFAYSGINLNLNLNPKLIIKYILVSFFCIAIFKYLMFFLLKRYRSIFKGNIRKTIILGKTPQSESLEKFLVDTPFYGFINKKIICFKDRSKLDIEAIFDYISNEEIDEIFCSISELNNEDLLAIVNYADNNLKVVKFIPDRSKVLSKKLRHDYYGIIPILTFRTIPLDDPFSALLKRVFDIVFSLAVIVLILSWLTPLIALVIKVESKGSVFFTQSRNGYNFKSFKCFKFRSMVVNPKADLEQVTRGDARITIFGQLLRKTSLDEMPQFFNVLKGDMSVVGPRPHMLSHTDMYAKKIDKFMVRHFVKPGITGLAQVSGFRGEVETDKDIIGRVQHDIFYIENWSFFLDLKIIFQTLYNTIKGEEKAY